MGISVNRFTFEPNVSKPGPVVLTTTTVTRRGEHKKRRRGQQVLFAAEGIKVQRGYDERGRLVSVNIVPVDHRDLNSNKKGQS